MEHFDIKKEADALADNLKRTTSQAFNGPVGILSNPIRFIFYAALLGASQLLIFQVFNGAVNRAMDEDD
jgi:hypothetical protein